MTKSQSKITVAFAENSVLYYSNNAKV